MISLGSLVMGGIFLSIVNVWEIVSVGLLLREELMVDWVSECWIHLRIEFWLICYCCIESNFRIYIYFFLFFKFSFQIIKLLQIELLLFIGRECARCFNLFSRCCMYGFWRLIFFFFLVMLLLLLISFLFSFSIKKYYYFLFFQCIRSNVVCFNLLLVLLFLVYCYRLSQDLLFLNWFIVWATIAYVL